jgi:hypothetical protein
MNQQEKPLTEKESLQLITEMIQKAKANIHERGTSAIMWGTVTAIAGLISFLERYYDFYIGFDIWIIVLAAVIPQIFLSIREAREKKVVTHTEKAIDAIWIVYGISIGCLIFFMNVVPGVSAKFFVAEHGSESLQNFPRYVYSVGSIFLILYAIPTLATGIICRFLPMLLGGIICYLLFIVSCYSSSTWDMLLMGLAGIINWLIPGFILRSRYLKGNRVDV